MNDRIGLPDDPSRDLAVTTFDRNVVVIAGAGTGKTALLVNRLVHLLMREPDPVDLTRVVALTFTNKAATEMRVRLRDRLVALAIGPADETAVPDAVGIQDLRDRYGLTADRIAARAQVALAVLEQAQIGTIHSFAAHLLRLYPLESGVAPDFREDDGLRFEEHFQKEWELWIDRELGPDGREHGRWRRLLAAVTLPELRELARACCQETVPLTELAPAQSSPAPVAAWLEEKHRRASALLASSESGKSRKVELLLEAARELFGSVLAQGTDLSDATRAAMAARLAGQLGSAPAGWSGAAFQEARELIGAAQRLLKVNGPLIAEAVALLLPLIRSVRQSFLEEGWVSFDGLLTRARDLLKDHRSIREQLKRDFRTVLVDEFQDTDPLQYEIILYLAERAGGSALTWEAVDLEPGKLFIVGDPKQSIYAFRRADIEAFQRVVGKIQASGGCTYELSANFRSDPAVLKVINAVFDRLFPHQEQPAGAPPAVVNIPLVARPDRLPALKQPGVELRLVKSADGEEFDAAAATRAEAEALAKWLKEDLLDKERIRVGPGWRPLRPGHVALLFRTLTQAHEYLDALSRYGLAYLTDGEKHFYRRQEVIDLVNLLRVLDDPYDAVALVGVLRSPLGAVTDRELVELQARGAFDYRHRERLAGWPSPHAQNVQQLYERLTELHQSVPHRPLPDVIDALFSRLPVLELAAASRHGEQAVANLYKVRQLAAEVADRPSLSLAGFVELMIDRLMERPDESEGALAEESLEAIRILTVHKAKGLEFPVVVLPGLHQGRATGFQAPAVLADWTTGLLGIMLRDCCTLGGAIVQEKTMARQEAEQRRILYVGMTRARDRLVLSGGLTRQRSSESFLGLLEIAGIEPATIRHTTVLAGDCRPPARRIGPHSLQPGEGLTEHLRRWEQREQAWSQTRTTPSRLTPTALMAAARRKDGPPATLNLLIGILAHRVLEAWDFQGDQAALAGRVVEICRRGIPPEQQHAAADIEAELQAMMKTFVASAPYRDLRRATILGREIPFAISWPSPLTPHASPFTPPCIMEGQIDLVYQLDGATWIMDYKTDRIGVDSLPAQALDYRTQAQIYREAVRRCLNLDTVWVQFMFLRTGQAVPVP